MERQFYNYILSNKYNKVLYTGITSDLLRRIYEYKQHCVKGFTARYNVTKLVYYEIMNDPESAITREKQIKAGSRHKKLELIKSINPDWKDLYYEL
jgi:putative endonuclease